jgi:hypothetical protein
VWAYWPFCCREIQLCACKDLMDALRSVVVSDTMHASVQYLLEPTCATMPHMNTGPQVVGSRSGLHVFKLAPTVSDRTAVYTVMGESNIISEEK